ncbi:MAG TPA: R3H domain-containing nucleic acid-binding protein [Chthoniobacterales bacterium]|jgi:spoIIIJ-associated protein
MNESPREILDTILGYLGFAFDIQEQERDGHLVLQVYTRDAGLLIGRHEQTLEDLQFLVNRLLLAEAPDAPRVIVDVEHHRDMRDDALVQKVQHLAEAVRNGGRPLQTEPMNAYDRRIVHHTFKDDPMITTWSPPEEARMKRITLRLRKKA